MLQLLEPDWNTTILYTLSPETNFLFGDNKLQVANSTLTELRGAEQRRLHKKTELICHYQLLSDTG